MTMTAKQQALWDFVVDDDFPLSVHHSWDPEWVNESTLRVTIQTIPKESEWFTLDTNDSPERWSEVVERLAARVDEDRRAHDEWRMRSWAEAREEEWEKEEDEGDEEDEE